MDNRQEFPECKVIFAPIEEIRTIEKVIGNLEFVHRELLKVADCMKSTVN